MIGFNIQNLDMNIGCDLHESFVGLPFDFDAIGADLVAGAENVKGFADFYRRLGFGQNRIEREGWQKQEGQ
jgi:hypothetical protein